MTAQNIQAILAKLDAQDAALGRIEARTTEIEAQVKATNGRVRTIEIWRARVEGAVSVGRNPVVTAVISGVAVAAVLTLLHLA